MTSTFPSRHSQRGGIILKLISCISILLVLGAIYLLRRPILRLIGGILVVSENPLPSDAIIVLGDDSFNGERATKAADLFRERWAAHVIASGRYIRPYATIADLEARDLAEHGVPQEAIVHFPNYAENTREEALAIRNLLRQRGWTRVIVVTSASHSRRARYIFQHVLTGVEMRMVAAPEAAYDPNSWWESRSGWKRFLYESLGMIMALWELRSTDSTTAPPSAPSRSTWPTNGFLNVRAFAGCSAV
ncbi:MAG: YdcF family protein [Acidobacteria bacterium]|nr:YdcF family protein [Acidobacteriota bacterium]